MNTTDYLYCEPPTWNVKCILFTFFVTSLYLFGLEGRANTAVDIGSKILSIKSIVFALCIYLPYLAMAHYDQHYGCKRSFGPTFLSQFYMWAKPGGSEQQYQYKNWCTRYKSLVFKVDVAVLIGLFSLMMASTPVGLNNGNLFSVLPGNFLNVLLNTRFDIPFAFYHVFGVFMFAFLISFVS